jgi:hypothetical protein
MSSSFTEAEVEKIQEAFWGAGLGEIGEGDVPCPKSSCGGIVHVAVAPELGFPRSLFARCDRCLNASSFESAPDLGPEFTDDQMRDFVDRHQRGWRPSCPEHEVPLTVVEHRALGGRLRYEVTCPRCGAHGELKWS